jgi:hypothetical protein
MAPLSTLVLVPHLSWGSSYPSFQALNPDSPGPHGLHHCQLSQAITPPSSPRIWDGDRGRYLLSLRGPSFLANSQTPIESQGQTGVSEGKVQLTALLTAIMSDLTMQSRCLLKSLLLL